MYIGRTYGVQAPKAPFGKLYHAKPVSHGLGAAERNRSKKLRFSWRSFLLL